MVGLKLRGLFLFDNTLAKITFPPWADLPMADMAKLSFKLDFGGEIATSPPSTRGILAMTI